MTEIILTNKELAREVYELTRRYSTTNAIVYELKGLQSVKRSKRREAND
nr:hypothetical protein [Candidatus Njordarchaeum guaymaensis]